ncbi:MAG: hypothetical protein ACI92G_003309 [Candidatus Pelagisphaera sp.]|jgi:hypothetical protein
MHLDFDSFFIDENTQARLTRKVVKVRFVT